MAGSFFCHSIRELNIYITTVVSVVLCKYEIWCTALMEGFSLWLFENRVIENMWTEERENNRRLGENLIN
jgi:hypothetical protein